MSFLQQRHPQFTYGGHEHGVEVDERLHVVSAVHGEDDGRSEEQVTQRQQQRLLQLLSVRLRHTVVRAAVTAVIWQDNTTGRSDEW